MFGVVTLGSACKKAVARFCDEVPNELVITDLHTVADSFDNPDPDKRCAHALIFIGVKDLEPANKRLAAVSNAYLDLAQDVAFTLQANICAHMQITDVQDPTVLRHPPLAVVLTGNIQADTVCAMHDTDWVCPVYPDTTPVWKVLGAIGMQPS